MEAFLAPWLGKPLWMWLLFLAVVVVLLALDLGVLHRKARTIGVRESLWMSGFYTSIALLFGVWVWSSLGEQAGEEYLTGFLVEKSLAIDNVFVISLIFGYFAVPPALQHRVLLWGIVGVIVLRAIMIGIGAALVADSGEWGTYAWGEHVLGAPGYRIAGGSDETQRNIIGERVLGLPGDVRVDKDVAWKDTRR